MDWKPPYEETSVFFAWWIIWNINGIIGQKTME
jgi:hypothetical protein